MNRKDAEVLAEQYMKRRVAEGYPESTAVALAFERYGDADTEAARKRMAKRAAAYRKHLTETEAA